MAGYPGGIDQQMGHAGAPVEWRLLEPQTLDAAALDHLPASRPGTFTPEHALGIDAVATEARVAPACPDRQSGQRQQRERLAAHIQCEDADPEAESEQRPFQHPSPRAGMNRLPVDIRPAARWKPSLQQRIDRGGGRRRQHRIDAAPALLGDRRGGLDMQSAQPAAHQQPRRPDHPALDLRHPGEALHPGKQAAFGSDAIVDLAEFKAVVAQQHHQYAEQAHQQRGEYHQHQGAQRPAERRCQLLDLDLQPFDGARNHAPAGLGIELPGQPHQHTDDHPAPVG